MFCLLAHYLNSQQLHLVRSFNGFGWVNVNKVETSKYKMSKDNSQEARLPLGYSRAHQQEVVSTNATCLTMAEAGASNGLWITASSQKYGRGSRGREWVSSKGNLFASLLLIDPSADKQLHTLTFVACLAIKDAIEQLNKNANNLVQLKWPNDVLLNGKKVSGILLENHLIQSRRAIIVGIGINVTQFPQETLYPATSLSQENIDSHIEFVFEALSEAFANRLKQWNEGFGFETIRQDWLKQAAGLNEAIRVKFPKGRNPEELVGIFDGLDENGMLRLETSKGIIKKVSVADIFFT